MITVRLTENYGGFQIEGSFDDLSQFYDDLGSVVGFDESEDDDEDLRRLLILGLMYDRIVSVFAQAIEQLATVLTPIQMNKVKHLLDLVSKSKFTVYRGAWLEVIATDFLKMTAKQRKQEIMRSISTTCEYYLYDEFHDMCRDIKSYAKRNNCDVKDVHLAHASDYADIVW